ncbi:protein translocase subunit SecF [Candidatus Peregrinibacteria bacterium]|jgi:preprotein translocase SecF subunit/protein-export membrane protein SecD|nr:protein translocase subunit SecF [Candidatus Peregrinibacteria bacterium]MBT4147806.1 protein translocase subunit SecF [Candidatus Peregrinibacteria bacterium]MBT4365824.1 protein translocase subunit SecF [Candidatus Peregrinibacteria bacterium]MBT4455673.1 protein translocase subunit SecF [Candidatus Peregrinibacteria bacterium]
MKKFFSWKIITILVATLVLGFFDAPNKVQQTILPFVPESITDTKIHLGLDLQGGSQLDYKIDLRKVPEEDRLAIIDGVTEVINRRVNNLGVAEPNIYTSELAGEFHVIVELADLAALTDADIKQYLKLDKTLEELTDDEKKTLSLEKAKATVGKTIQLEFKEQKEKLDPQEKEKVQAQAQAALEKIKSGTDFDVVGQEEQLAYPGKVRYETSEFVFANEIVPEALADAVMLLAPEAYTSELVEVGGSFVITETGETQEDTALVIARLDETTEETKFDKKVEASHILVAWAGATNASEEVTRTEEEAYEEAKVALAKINEQGTPFDRVALFHSDDPSNKENGGKLTVPVTGDGTYVYDFEQAALALKNSGDISDIIKTEFGYHIIKADNALNDVKEVQYKYTTIRYSTTPDPWKDTSLTGKNFVHADVQLDQFYQPYITIEFDDEGSRLFEEITGRNVGKPVAIFVGGNLISAPRVNEKIVGGHAQITGSFSQDEATTLARDLNTGAIPAPIVLTGEYTIGATLGQNALRVSIWAGLIGFLILCAYMLLRYRIPGILATVALVVYGVILLFLIKSELHLGIALPVAVVSFLTIVYKTLNSKDSGGEKTITFLLSCVVFFFITFLLKTGVVMTLAGVAGLILSLGMAVDANILIFERFKEELRAGRPYTSAVEEGFHRAWSSIRDSNFSTLITCGVLFYFGTSIIRGFAFNLAAGILISMFTAITVTKVLLHALGTTKYSKDLKYLGVNPEKTGKTNFKFIKNSKKFLSFSGVLIGISIVAVLAFGFRPGIDFTGGTLMEVKFSEPVTKEQLQESLIEIQEEINTGVISTPAELEAPAEPEAKLLNTAYAEDEVAVEGGETLPEDMPVEDLPETTAEEVTSPDVPLIMETAETLEPETELLDLKNIQIVPSGDNSFIIKTKYLESETHDTIIEKLGIKLGSLTEPRFTTVGPTIGSTLKQKAIFAIFATILIIILYVAFAFRKIPKAVSPWRFGVSAIIALVHDVIIVTGFFIILSTIINIEIDALFITALLTILGYSVNDTIVVFDRVRENLKTAGRDEPLEDIADRALNQTLGRSLNTSVTSLITVIALFIGSFYGGAEAIRYFLLALIAGMAIGTYSSIFVASSGLVIWTKWAAKKADEKLRKA